MLRSEDCVAGTEDEPRFVEVAVAGARLLVARMADGEVVAFAALCPHLATPLEGATLRAGRLRCARHLYEYDVRTGENVVPARGARRDLVWRLRPGYLAVHRVEERDGWIRVAVAPEPPPAAYDPDVEQGPGAGG